MPERPTTIDSYIARFPDDVRTILEEMRARIHAVVPDAGEKISYQIPTMTIGGKNFMHFAGWKEYVSIYPVPEDDSALLADLTPYRASKGTMRFPLADPIPYDLVERVAIALAERRTSGRV